MTKFFVPSSGMDKIVPEAGGPKVSRTRRAISVGNKPPMRCIFCITSDTPTITNVFFSWTGRMKPSLPIIGTTGGSPISSTPPIFRRRYLTQLKRLSGLVWYICANLAQSLVLSNDVSSWMITCEPSSPTLLFVMPCELRTMKLSLDAEDCSGESLKVGRVSLKLSESKVSMDSGRTYVFHPVWRRSWSDRNV